MTQVVTEVLPPDLHDGLMVLSGPSFMEVSQGQPTALCLAGTNAALVGAFQAALSRPPFVSMQTATSSACSLEGP